MHLMPQRHLSAGAVVGCTSSRWLPQLESACHRSSSVACQLRAGPETAAVMYCSPVKPMYSKGV